MTYPSWPTDLPQKFDQGGFGATVPDDRRLTDMEQGPPKARAPNRPGMRTVRAQMTVTLDEFARFEWFWNNQIANGVSWFYLPGQVYHDAVLADGEGGVLVIEPETTDGEVSLLVMQDYWLAMFTREKPEVSALAGAHWRVTFGLTVVF